LGLNEGNVFSPPPAAKQGGGETKTQPGLKLWDDQTKGNWGKTTNMQERQDDPPPTKNEGTTNGTIAAVGGPRGKLEVKERLFCGVSKNQKKLARNLNPFKSDSGYGAT